MNTKFLIKISLFLIILALFIGFFYFGGHRYATFESLKANKDGLQQWTNSNLLLASLTFFTIYVFCTALSLPGAVIFTLASGLIFGLGLGTLISSFASSIGAGLAFLASRYLLRDWVEYKFGSRLEKINEGFRNEGAYYLFTLRLMPIFPFFILNLLMGLTAIRFWTYYIVSQIAMLPATFIYVNAGTQLSEISSTKDILSPTVLFSLVLLGLFPILIKKALRSFQKGM